MHWSREPAEPSRGRNTNEPPRREDRKGNAKKRLKLLSLVFFATTGSKPDGDSNGVIPASWQFPVSSFQRQFPGSSIKF